MSAKRYVVVDKETGIVQNAVMLDDEPHPSPHVSAWVPPEGTFLIPHDEAEIGHKWTGKKFVSKA